MNVAELSDSVTGVGRAAPKSIAAAVAEGTTIIRDAKELRVKETDRIAAMEDGDGQGDACDACPNDAANDADDDGVCGDIDNCPSASNGSPRTSHAPLRTASSRRSRSTRPLDRATMGTDCEATT